MKRRLTLIFFSMMFAVCSAFAVSGCAETTSDGTEKHNHTYTTSIVAPTCEEQGYTLHVCSCGESYKDNYVAALAHNFENYLCTKCNKIDPSAPDTEGLEYSLSRDGESYAVSGIGKATENYIKIPSTYNGKPVTSIMEKAFYKCSSFTSVTIPKSVTSIGGSAFWGCGSLISVTIPNSVTALSDSIFSNCCLLKNITIPNGVTSIGKYAFQKCAFTSISIPDSVKIISDSAFSYCSNLTSIIIPNGITTLSDHVFAECSELTNIFIPNSVTMICDYAFAWCSALLSIHIPNSVTFIGDDAFCDCSSLVSINIPDSVAMIDDYAFHGCSGLVFNEYENGCYLGNEKNPYVVLVKIKNKSITNFTINENTKFIQHDAFSKFGTFNNSLIYNEYENGCYLGNDSNPYLVLVRVKDEAITNFFINENTKFIQCDAFGRCFALLSIKIPNSVTSIGSSAFSGCSSLTSITIPNSVTSIGSSAFSGCSSLTSITIPNSVTFIGSSAFGGCRSLTSITIPNGVTSIGHEAFRGCSSLTSITIPDSVTSISHEVFYYCSSLTNINYEGTKAQWYEIKKHNNWDWEAGNYIIHCTDGDIETSN